MAATTMNASEILEPPHFPRTPSLTSSDGTSGSSELDFPLKKALPAIPTPEGKRPDSFARISFVDAHASESRRSRALSSFMVAPSRLSRSFITALKHPNVLACLLEYLPWTYFYSLTSTSREFRHILRIPALKDVVLSQYVPGYKSFLATRDLHRFQDVPTTMSHLDLLSECRTYIPNMCHISLQVNYSDISTCTPPSLSSTRAGLSFRIISIIRAGRADAEIRCPHAGALALCAIAPIPCPQFIPTNFPRTRRCPTKIW